MMIRVIQMHVCFISFGKAGGAETSMFDLIDVLVCMGVHVSVITGIDDYVTKCMRERGIQVDVCRFDRWTQKPGSPHPRLRTIRYLLRRWRDGMHLARRIRQIGPDVVVSNTLTFGAGATASRRAHVPHIAYIREFGDRDHGLQFELGIDRSLRLLGRWSQYCVFMSEALSDGFAHQIPREKRRVVYDATRVPSGVIEAADVYQRPSEQPFTCVIVGGLTEGKGQHEAIESVGQLRDAGVDVRLHIVGKGNRRYCRDLEEQIARLKLGERVVMLGYRDEPYESMFHADASLVCSRCEAFGRVTIEAMKLGRPVIGSNSGGTPELIDDHRTGLLYEPGNASDLTEEDPLDGRSPTRPPGNGRQRGALRAREIHARTRWARFCRGA